MIPPTEEAEAGPTRRDNQGTMKITGKGTMESMIDMRRIQGGSNRNLSGNPTTQKMRRKKWSRREIN